MVSRSSVIGLTVASMGYQVTQIVCEFICLGLILPEDIGVWQTAFMFKTFVGFSRLGIINGLNREYPFSLGKGRSKRANGFLESATIYGVLSGSIGCIGALGIGVVGYFTANDLLLSAFFVVGISALVEPVTQIAELKMRGRLKFGQLAVIRVIQTLVLGFTLLLVWQSGIWGYLTRFAIVSLFGVVAVVVAAKLSVPKLQKKRIRPRLMFLFAVGWRIWLANYLRNLSKSFPGFSLLFWGDFELVGTFAPVQKVGVAMAALIGNIVLWLMPIMTRKLAAHGESLSPLRLPFWVAIGVFVGVSPFIVLWLIFCGWIIDGCLPEYVAVVPALRIASLAMWIEVYPLLLTAYFVNKAWTRVFRFVTLIVVSRAVLIFGVGFFFTDLMLGIAIAMLLSNITIAIVMFSDAFLQIRRTPLTV